MNLFAEQIQELNTTDHKKAALWDNDDLISRMTVVIRDTNNPEIDRVSVRLGGTTPIRIINNKSSFTIKKGSLNSSEILEQIRGQKTEELLPILKDAHSRLLDSLHKAKSSKAKKLSALKRLEAQDSSLLIVQKQEEKLRIEVNVNRLKRDKKRATTLAS